MHAKKEKELKKLFKRVKKNKTTGEISVQFMDYEKLNKFLDGNLNLNFKILFHIYLNGIKITLKNIELTV